MRKILPTIGKNIFCELLNNNAINETFKNVSMGKLEGIHYNRFHDVCCKAIDNTLYNGCKFCQVHIIIEFIAK